MRYGLPYKGSKNAIADWIVNTLPKAEIFVDLFCGGGAVTHCAMLKGKYGRFIMNDIDGRLPVLFRDCAHGLYTTQTHPEWICREEFNRRKAEDAYIALLWSFSNNGKDYLYGRDIEDFKHAYHILLFEGNPEPIKCFGYEIKLAHDADIQERYLKYKRQIRDQTKNHRLGKHPFDLDSATRQIEVERLQSLQSLQSHYLDVQIPKGALIYCDIPYFGTNCGKYHGFNHAEFYEWAERQDNIFISEYWMPEQFICIASREKSVLSSNKGECAKATERIFTNRRTYEHYGGVFCENQLTLF